MKRAKVSLLVILYNKDLKDSETLQSILKFQHSLDNLCIVNNGPKDISLDNTFLKELTAVHRFVEFKNYTENKPLSWIYNDFVAQYFTDYYVIFDDDTVINVEFENSLFELTDTDLELPKIFARDEKQYYPIVEQEIYVKEGVIKNSVEIFSIGSGLVFSNRLVTEFKTRHIELFDSRFALYGVDISLFRKLNTFLANSNLIISSSTYLNHSLSRSEGGMSEWRKIERIYDEVLSIKYYSSYPFWRVSKYALKKILVGEASKVFLIFRTYFSGFHPRCKKYKA